MPGKAKRKYVGEIIRFNKGLRRPLKLIFEVLPYTYDENTVIDLFKELYPYEWKIINQRYKNYKEKDEFLVKHGKKKRYKPEQPKDYLLNLSQVKYRLRYKGKQAHKRKFNEEEQSKKYLELKNKRMKAINKKKEKIDKSRELIQNIEPLYIEAFIAAYHKRGITTEGKIEIFKELQKYDCDKSRDFFYKLNDSEKNNQIRNMAFKHLQDIGQYVKLRKHFKGKKKTYMTEKSDFRMTPYDLLKRIEENSIQNKKSFDMFISHSVRDSKFIKELIKILNREKMTSYCDWTSDSDFLKRELVSDYTKVVLKKRLEQSKLLIFIRTKDSIKSPWVKFELDYFMSLGKRIYYIDFVGNEKIDGDLIDDDIINGLREIYIDNNKEKIIWKNSDE